MAEAEIYRSSTFAPVNIAVIKYWGKRDTKLNLPTNSSLSVTLSQDDLRTHTTASCSDSFTSETLTLNDAPQDISGARTQACLRELRTLRQKIESTDPNAPKLSQMKLKIVSQNNFPTAAGLASSAAGFAALVRSIADLYALPSTPTELSRIARQGSGSACRSLFGGYVAWNQGSQPDGSDSVAYSVAEQAHWPEMRALILVASAEKKDVSSTSGMQATVATSTLFQHRVENVVPGRMEGMEQAIREKDFPAFADLTMKDSNNFHATCLDTSPPILYLNDTSRAAIRICNAINSSTEEGKPICAYTFDAGPNAVVYYLASHTDLVAGVFKAILGSELEGWEGVKGKEVQAGKCPEGFEHVGEVLRKGVGRVILTSVGDGPRGVEEHLC
ncbi:diphosphomevalonate decarboxylase [Elasticomyces elasticus]|nr:diphosphomevalonate decarboxylase [Elasticomyces elasticus]